MNAEEARLALASEATEVRLSGARFFSRSSAPDQLAYLRECLDRETVPWIRRALVLAVERAGISSERDRQAADDSVKEAMSIQLNQDQILARATTDATTTIVHEFSPVIGLLRVYVAEDIGEKFSVSRSKRLLDQLSGLLRAVRSLRVAAQPPKFSEFLISDFVAQVVDSTPNEHGASIRMVGPQNLLVSADKNQLLLAFGNGLRNAIEAVLERPGTDAGEIAISWGSTGAENYLVIKDSGLGFTGDPESALRLGATTKENHSGFGLALAVQAMRSMQGDVLVKNDNPGGHFEIRWFRENEDPIR
ncbi:MAG: ATP-binding protein [Lysobacteraceae bacterium]